MSVLNTTSDIKDIIGELECEVCFGEYASYVDVCEKKRTPIQWNFRTDDEEECNALVLFLWRMVKKGYWVMFNNHHHKHLYTVIAYITEDSKINDKKHFPLCMDESSKKFTIWFMRGIPDEERDALLHRVIQFITKEHEPPSKNRESLNE